MRITDYLKETRGELKHVSWPTRRQALVLSAFVIGISLFTAFFLGVFDFFFTTILKLIIGA
ncbi:preprotein translocase subunit SecE [Candidatus Kaiserbacteria bacterium RIFCSPHIGHO2_02_FULL_50_9]|uniref:Protein translocase subunit SecE n=1 Tax=Candidatus Kaiserbacteria bacterium RIFCSPLOWO2_01_FULL_51_21 TaxID=1798508 RepID=A0A1F6ED75_9BACT|nr:MAG: preprotein translocase subunit SecE [Candidatus Kaiserbacteria bacterium RIFCSPHIGHO2_01_FULL_51_33]OGG63786.1 MAG: preprotein translocase subunit SecE [Candidatus Kaiserbacteria bacterium RIFCSPHIGHO2_02_FULL_50_9]OGG71618.1 MAG: preprotein translocase subunit SecE [Candidatus Kaiserbacteria bacterium RIFCSPLOWO2_01_FULL_51_21]